MMPLLVFRPISHGLSRREVMQQQPRRQNHENNKGNCRDTRMRGQNMTLTICQFIDPAGRIGCAVHHSAILSNFATPINQGE